MAAVLLALSAATLWGVADFYGGALARRVSALLVAVIAQVAGFAGLLIAWAFLARPLETTPLVEGLAAGVFGAAALVLIYRALALGTMSVVAPIIACAALVPFAAGLLRGERPAALALTGAILAVGGSAIAALPERRSGVAERSLAVLVALGAMIALGGYALFIGLAGQDGDAFAGVLGARFVSLPLLLGVLALRSRRAGSGGRLDRPGWAIACGIGVVDAAGNTCYALASAAGLLSIAAALGALTPVVTVLLAHLVLRERIGGTQRLGVVAALLGAVLVSAA